MTTNAAAKRETAVKAILNAWIGMEGPDLGKLVSSRTFADLLADVEALKPLGRTKRWNDAILQWQGIIVTAVQNFATENDFSESVVWANGVDSYSFVTSREFAAVIKWAVHQGTIYAWYGCN